MYVQTLARLGGRTVGIDAFEFNVPSHLVCAQVQIHYFHRPLRRLAARLDIGRNMYICQGIPEE